MGGAEADPPTYKIGTFFLIALALSVTIFNQKYHHTKAKERLKLQKLSEPAPSTTLVEMSGR